MKCRFGILLTMAVMFVAGCSTVPVNDIRINTEIDTKANFSGYKTYSWLGTAAILHDVFGQFEKPEFDADMEAKYLINRELRKRGMAESTDNPDMLVAFAAGVDMDALGLKVDPVTNIEKLGYVPQAGIIVALIDSQTELVIWAGAAKGDVQEDLDSATIKARLDYAVTQMFQKLPN